MQTARERRADVFLISEQELPSRVFGSFVLLTNEQHFGPLLPGSLHQKVLGFLPSSEVEL